MAQITLRIETNLTFWRAVLFLCTPRPVSTWLLNRWIRVVPT